MKTSLYTHLSSEPIFSQIGFEIKRVFYRNRQYNIHYDCLKVATILEWLLCWINFRFIAQYVSVSGPKPETSRITDLAAGAAETIWISIYCEVFDKIDYKIKDPD